MFSVLSGMLEKKAPIFDFFVQKTQNILLKQTNKQASKQENITQPSKTKHPQPLPKNPTKTKTQKTKPLQRGKQKQVRLSALATSTAGERMEDWAEVEGCNNLADNPCLYGAMTERTSNLSVSRNVLSCLCFRLTFQLLPFLLAQVGIYSELSRYLLEFFYTFLLSKAVNFLFSLLLVL